MPEISVIVPVYDVEKYIHRCVDSILSQTFADFELILVDDGSPDNCGAICDEYARKDSRVHVIHQKNGGLSAARNAGIDWVFANSDSQWFTFIDSDDWIHPEMLSFLLRAVVENDVKVCACGDTITHGEMPVLPQMDYEVKLYSPESAFTTCICGKLLHRDCFQTIRFPVGKLHEDEFTTYRILFQQKKIAVTEAPLYFYFQNLDGITKSPWSPRRLDALEAKKEQTEYFKRNGFKETYAITAVEYATVILQHRDYVQDSDLDDQEKEKYERYLMQCLRKALWDHKGVFLIRELWMYGEAFPVLLRIYRKAKGLLTFRRKG